MANKLFFDGTGLQFGVDPLNNPSVPGANTTQNFDDFAADPKVAAAIEEMQNASTQADTEELTEEEKAIKEHEDKGHAADLKALEHQKSKIEAEKAATEAGRQPSEQEQVTALGQDLLETAPEHFVPDAISGTAPLLSPSAVQPSVGEQAAADAGVHQSQAEAAGEQQVAAAQTDGAEMRAFIGQQDANIKTQLAGDDLRRIAQNDVDIERQEFDDKMEAHAQRIQAVVSQNPRRPTASVANLIGVFLGGLLAPQQGGRNVALETVMAKLQSETDVLMENRRAELSGLRQAGGQLRDERSELGRRELERNVVLQQKIEGVQNMYQAEFNKEHLPAVQRAQAKETWAAWDREKAKLNQEAAIRKGEALRSEDEMAFKREKEASKGGKRGSGGGGGKGRSTEHQGVGAVYYDAAEKRNIPWADIPEKEKKQARGELAHIRLLDHSQPDANGNPRRIDGIRGLDDKAAIAIRKARTDSEAVGMRTSRILWLLDKVKGADRLVLGGATKHPAAAMMEAEFTELMVALKDQWELGAIQAPDMKLLEGAMGRKPTGAWAALTDEMDFNQIESVMQNMRNGGALKMKQSVFSGSGLGPQYSLELDKQINNANVADLEARFKEEIPDTTGKLIGNVVAHAEAGDPIDKDLEGIRDGIADGTVDQAALSTIVNEAKKLPPKEKAQTYNMLDQQWHEDQKAGRKSQLGVAPKNADQVGDGLVDEHFRTREIKKRLEGLVGKPGSAKRNTPSAKRIIKQFEKDYRESGDFKRKIAKRFRHLRDGTVEQSTAEKARVAQKKRVKGLGESIAGNRKAALKAAKRAADARKARK